MRFWDIVMAAATQGGGAAAAPAELFPDPTLADVTDSTNGWLFAEGFPLYGPLGGTGPGIQVDGALEADARLAEGGTNSLTFASAVSNGATVSVSLTIAGFVTAPDDFVIIVKDGSGVSFTPSGNGVITHEVVAGSGDGVASSSFAMLVASENPPEFNITAISVEAV